MSAGQKVLLSSIESFVFLSYGSNWSDHYKKERLMNIHLSNVVSQYLGLAQSPLPHRDDETIMADFSALCALPDVQAVSFYDTQTLMVGTHMISITDPETKLPHDIGEFIIYQHRKREGKIWDVFFLFQNITNVLDRYHHPHISSSYIAGYGDFGTLCIQRGQFHVCQHIRNGDFYQSTKALLEILYTYNPRTPFHKVHNWPLQKGVCHD